MLSASRIKVTAPKGYPIELIENFISAKKDWIEKKIEIYKSVSAPEFFSGGKVPYLGTELILKPDTSIEITERQGHILKVHGATLKNEEKKIKSAVIEWYRQETFKLCSVYAEHYAARLRVEFKKIEIRNFKSRWGSCSADKKLTFNWQMIFLEPTLFKYIVAHEVCHLLEMNHGVKFYEHLKFLGFDKNQIHRKMRESTRILHL